MTRTSVNGSPPAPSVVILGSDALVVCLPATPTQLANACFAAGFHGVFPASWGDELVAAGCVKALEQRSGPAIQCSCPLVLEQLRGVRSLHRYMVPLVSPPVATARYLRAMCEQAPLHITYVGDCPGADDPTIDRRMSPRELQALFEERGIVPSAQRPDLGDNPPRDRRRYYSLPGGVPAPEWLGTDWPKRVLVDTDASEALAELAHRAHGRENALIDLAPQLGCACSGAGPGVAAVDGRRSVTALEPPRARSDILDPKLAVEVFAAPVGEPPGPEVTWTDFLDSLPSTLSLDSQAHEQGTGPTTRSSRQSTKPHRRPSGQVALPRAYLRTRGNTRRPKERTEAEAIFAATPPRAPSEGPSLRPSSDEAKPSELRQEREPERPPRREESLTSARRREETLTSPRVRESFARRASAAFEEISGPLFRRVSLPLSTADRWLLVGLVVLGSLMASGLTSFLLLRGLGGRVGSELASSDTVAPKPSRVMKGDSVIASPPLIPATLPLGDQRTLDSASRGAPPSSAVAADTARPATGPTAHGGGVAVAPVPPKASPTRGAPSRVAAKPRPRTPAPKSAVAQRASPVTAHTAAPLQAALPPAAPAPPPVTAPAATVAPPPAARPPDTTRAPAAQTVDVAAEIRAIREELDRRRKRVDSLTGALDSMKRVPTP